MFEADVVPSVNVCKYLAEHGWTAKVSHEWRKGSLAKHAIVVGVPMQEGLELLIPYGTEEFRYAAPTARELFDALPNPITVDKTAKGEYHVSCELTPNQGMFQISDKLEDALADLWNALRVGKHI